MPTFENTLPRINLNQIQLIEGYVGLKLPSEYKEHLLLFNGGECYPADFAYIENGEKTEGTVDRFLPISDDESENIREYIDTYKKEDLRLPERILPIAYDPGGNLICISCGGKDNGAIYFWDHESEVDNPESNESNLFFIASTFKKFIGMLTDLG